MSFSNVSVEYLPDEKSLVRRMHYASFPSMFRSNPYEALAVGNSPKRCPICKRFFLTTNARRQVYCEGYAPDEYGGLSCRQVGNRMGREHREQAQNHPMLVLYHQTVNTIAQRVSRRTLDKGIAEKAKAIARDKRNMAIAMPEYANGDYKTEMDPDALFAEVTRKQNVRRCKFMPDLELQIEETAVQLTQQDLDALSEYSWDMTSYTFRFGFFYLGSENADVEDLTKWQAEHIFQLTPVPPGMEDELQNMEKTKRFSKEK